MRSKLLLAVVLCELAGVPTFAGEGKLKGYMFGDYFYVVSADDGERKNPEKRNAFRFRRIYFTYEKDLSGDFSTRYRLEANDAGFGKGDKMNPFVKHAYLKWKKAVGGADLYLGLPGTPTWANSEKVWGYRSIEATVMDLNKYGSSADIGAALKGKSGKLNYHLMVGNGPGQKPEGDHGKKIYGSVSFKATDELLVEGYGDFNMLPGGRDEMTVKGFAGLTNESFKGGVEVFTRIHKKAGRRAQAGDDVTITGMSAFGSLAVKQGLKGFGRVDAINNNDTETTDVLVIAGLDHSPTKNVHLMPNIYITLPDGPDPNIMARMTLFFKH
jgi:hypothetical protein